MYFKNFDFKSFFSKITLKLESVMKFIKIVIEIKSKNF